MSAEMTTARDRNRILKHDAIRTRAGRSVEKCTTREDRELVKSRSATREREALIVFILMRVAGREDMRGHRTWHNR